MRTLEVETKSAKVKITDKAKAGGGRSRHYIRTDKELAVRELIEEEDKS